MWAPLLAGLSRLFASRVGQWVAGALAWLGLSLVTYEVGVEPLLEQVRDIAAGATGEVVQWLGYLHFDKALTMIMSAVAARFGLQAGRAFLARR